LTLACPSIVDAQEVTASASALPVARIGSNTPDSRHDDPFLRRGWHLELGGHGALETWNYNISHEEMYGIRPGFAYGLGKGVTFIAGWPLYYVSQRGVDAYLFGATLGLRGRISRHQRVSTFYEFELGISESDTSVPPRGTRFNYLALGGGGLTIRLRRGVHLLSGLKWVHVSNNGLAGRNRNPDIEAVGVHSAVLIRF
jgi:hypothetical protein